MCAQYYTTSSTIYKFYLFSSRMGSKVRLSERTRSVRSQLRFCNARPARKNVRIELRAIYMYATGLTHSTIFLSYMVEWEDQWHTYMWPWVRSSHFRERVGHYTSGVVTVQIFHRYPHFRSHEWRQEKKIRKKLTK